MIDDCSPGTSHFVVVAAVNAVGGLVARSQQHTVQTTASVKQPALQLRCAEPVVAFLSLPCDGNNLYIKYSRTCIPFSVL